MSIFERGKFDSPGAIISKHAQTLSGIRLVYDHLGSGDWMILAPHSCAGNLEFEIITGRNLSKTEREIPTISNRIKKEKGKIVIIGNGLSPIPLLLAHSYKHEEIHQPAVICDLFNYADLASDLSMIEETFATQRVEFPFSLHLDTARKIAKNVQGGFLQGVIYEFGTGHPPSILAEADLVINSFGPSRNSLPEQLSLLAYGGELYTTDWIYPSDVGSEFEVAPLERDGRQEATAISRIT